MRHCSPKSRIVQQGTRDEIGALADHLKRMATALERRAERARRHLACRAQNGAVLHDDDAKREEPDEEA
jgi:hypothetical protein